MYDNIAYGSLQSKAGPPQRGAVMRQATPQRGAPRGVGRGGASSTRPVAKEAWGDPHGGDESFPPPAPSVGTRGRSIPPRAAHANSSKQQFSTKSNVVSKASSSRATESPGEVLRVAFYDPPASPEQLAAKLKISFVGNPQITKVALMQRLAQLNPNLSKPELAAIWTSLAQDCGGNASTAIISLDDFHQYFGKKFGKDKSSKSSNVIDRVIAKIMERCGGGGLKGLQR